MVTKVLGLASGALVASLGVWAFNDWRHVSDDDRLTAILQDHCLPYVRSGDAPFDGMGRSPGVYDRVDLNDGFKDGGALLIHDARFVAQWGLSADSGPDGDTTFRVCDVKPTYGTDTVAGFVVAPDGFIARYSDVIAPDGALVADRDAVPDSPVILGWFNENGDQSDGLRVVMAVSTGLVSSLLVGLPLAE
ncbi:hypothetical protein L0664_08745 [Octadecabacter sp. G9-8]|uniref:Uncharacterized protein n=1 Tax=Octadecabacter dasysiphoniae TaxID=2909341 RepID=A0ABS9CV71_9RHOB|nr:hypothetical protein [Octadecabacter dasysiphoniae]MCF2871152.1 hypothetical protein [Octadecabacter dasysiphoniae]